MEVQNHEMKGNSLLFTLNVSAILCTNTKHGSFFCLCVCCVVLAGRTRLKGVLDELVQQSKEER